jgi:hypothetical protein
MALAGETGELLAELQWLTPEESARVMRDPDTAGRVRSELADVALYLPGGVAMPVREQQAVGRPVVRLALLRHPHPPWYSGTHPRTGALADRKISRSRATSPVRS